MSEILLEDGSGALIIEAESTESTIFFFVPPTIMDVPPTLPNEETGPAYRLFRHYKSRPRGENVYLYAEGSPSALVLGVASTVDPYTIYDSNGVAISTGWSDIELIFWGGHEGGEVTEVQAAALSAAGFTVEGYSPLPDATVNFLLESGDGMLAEDDTLILMESVASSVPVSDDTLILLES